MIFSRRVLRIGVLVGAAACHAPAVAPAPTSSARAPALFAAGVITGPPTFSPDGNTAYFSRKRTIVVSHRRGDGWSDPEVAPFSGTWGDVDPAMAPDGSFLIFASNRPAGESGDPLDGAWGTPERKVFKGMGGNLWRVERVGDHWGPAQRLPDTVNRGTAVFEPSVVADGSLYFMDAHQPGNFRLYRSQLRNGRYEAPVQLPFTDGTSSDWDLTVAPDESFLVFASDRAPVPADHGDDLFLVRRTAGTWGPVTHLGPGINDPDTGSVKPRLGADHHTLYFLSDRPVSGAPSKPAFHLWQVDLAATLNAAR